MPRRNTLAPAIIVAVLFAIFAAVLVAQIAKLNLHALGSVFDLMGMLFDLFWIIGWSVAVLTLGALMLFLLSFGESARLAGGRLVYVLNVGPLKMITEYELARMHNLGVEADASGEGARLRFDYDGLRRSLGDTMPRGTAERNLAALRRSMTAVEPAPTTEFEAQPEPPPPVVPPAVITRRPRPLASTLALIAANLIPLLSVLLGGWTLEQVMVLFWAESAVIGFYTLLKMGVVARWWAIFPGVLFVAHFGGFMAIHFLFIYELFVRGIHATGPDLGALEALARLFVPLWPALLALLLSHAVSFLLNFIGEREYENAKVTQLMTAPYGRIVLMQFTLIFGGWMVMLLKNPVPALVLLIVLKLLADLRGHYGERAAASRTETPGPGGK